MAQRHGGYSMSTGGVIKAHGFVGCAAHDGMSFIHRRRAFARPTCLRWVVWSSDVRSCFRRSRLYRLHARAFGLGMAPARWVQKVCIIDSPMSKKKDMGQPAASLQARFGKTDSTSGISPSVCVLGSCGNFFNVSVRRLLVGRFRLRCCRRVGWRVVGRSGRL